MSDAEVPVFVCMVFEREVQRPASGMFKSAVVGLLLFSVVASSIVGAGTMFFLTLLVAWLLFPVLVGFRNTLDARCVFMLITLGVVVVVGLARYGPGSLLP